MNALVFTADVAVIEDESPSEQNARTFNENALLADILALREKSSE